MKKNIITKIILYFFGTIIAGLGVALVFGGVFLARIHYTPLILKNLHPSIVRSFEAIIPKYKVSFDYAIVTWKGIGSPVLICAENVKVQEIEEKHLKATLPKLQVSFSISRLLIGKFSIRTLEIIKPSLYFIYKNISPSLKASSEIDDHLFLTFIDNFLEEKKNLRKLKHIKIEQADIKIENFRREELLHVPNLIFTLERRNKKQEFNLTGATQKNTFQLTGANDPKAGEIWGHLNIYSRTHNMASLIQPQELNKKASQPQNKNLFLQEIVVPFSVKSKFHYSEKEGLKTASFILNFNEGKIEIPSVFTQPIEVKKGVLEAFYMNNQLQVKKLEVQTGKTHIKATAEGVWNQHSQEITFKGKAETEDVFFSDLNKFWPKNLANTSRQWVIKNITQGRVPKATFELDSVITLRDKKVTVSQPSLEGIIKIQDATVSYLEGMPKVTHVYGEARYSLKDFLIKLDSGKTHQLKLESGRIDIKDLDKEIQNIDIQLNVHGSLSQHLSLVDHKPLEYAKKLTLKPSQISGKAQTFVHLKFPLLTTITLNEIQVDIKSQLLETKLLNILTTFPCELYNGKFDLKINNKNMLLEGQGHVVGIPLQITWQRNFDLDSIFDNKLDLACVIDEQFFNHQKISFVQEFVGKAPLEIHYLGQMKSQGNLQAKVDLTKVRARILGWLKPEMVQGGVEVSMEMRNLSPHKLHFIRAKVSEDIHIEGEGSFDNLGLKQLNFSHFKVGLTNIHFNILRQNNQIYMVKLLGKSLNLEPLWQNLLNTSNESLKSDFELKADVNNVFLGIDRIIYNNHLSLKYSKGVLSHLDFKAALSKKNPNTMFKINLSASDAYTRKVKLKTAHGGKFLKAFGIYDNVYGGNLSILATHDDRMLQDPWQGGFVLKDFSLKKAPIMGRLLTLAFPTGVVDLFSEKGLPFNHFRSKFSATANKVVFTKGHANGMSIGLTFAGAVDLQKKNLHLHGSVIPAYHLNTILSKIPLIGELASGGKHEGLFSVAYTISGDNNNPQITVNPVSILTPGFFRKIFEPDIDESFDVNEEEEYKELRD